MTQEMNPYAPPSSSLEFVPEGSVWRDKDTVVLIPQGVLPSRCIKCNESIDTPIKKRKIYWHHPALYLLALVNLIIYAIVALIVRKSATINPGLCKHHNSKRNMAIAGGWVGSIFGIVVSIASLVSDSCGVAAFGGILFLGSLIVSIMLARILYPTKISADFIRLKGAGKAFLDSLPAFRA